MNSIGCADLDGDGIFSNVDDCPNTLEKWTPNSEGCAVYQMPVSWSQNGYGNGRMDIVADFTVPHWMAHGHLAMSGLEMMSIYSYSSTQIVQEMEITLIGQRIQAQ